MRQLLTGIKLVQPSGVPVLQTELEPEPEPVGVATARRGAAMATKAARRENILIL